jgi:PiT family inorganic phosphate transporter
MVVAWILTLPAAAAIGALAYAVTDLFPGAVGPILLSALGLTLAAAAFVRRWRTTVAPVPTPAA